MNYNKDNNIISISEQKCFCDLFLPLAVLYLYGQTKTENHIPRFQEREGGRVRNKERQPEENHTPEGESYQIKNQIKR